MAGILWRWEGGPNKIGVTGQSAQFGAKSCLHRTYHHDGDRALVPATAAALVIWRRGVSGSKNSVALFGRSRTIAAANLQ